MIENLRRISIESRRNLAVSHLLRPHFFRLTRISGYDKLSQNLDLNLAG